MDAETLGDAVPYNPCKGLRPLTPCSLRAGLKQPGIRAEQSPAPYGKTFFNPTCWGGVLRLPKRKLRLPAKALRLQPGTSILS